MADFEVDDIVRLGAVQVFDSAVDVVNVFHLRIKAGGPLAFAAASLDFQEYLDGLFNPLATLLSSVQVADSISVQNVTQGTVWGSIAWDTYSGGSNIADPLPPTDTLLAFARTAASRVQIRKYLGVFCEADQGAGEWSAAVRAAGLTFMNYHIVRQVMSNGLDLQGIAYNRATGAANLGISGATSLAVCTQRRRRRGRGS